MRVTWYVLAAIVVACLASYLVSRHDDAKLQALRASRDSLRGAVIALNVETQARATAQRQTEDSLRQQLRRSRGTVVVVQGRTDTLLASIPDTTLRDSLSAALKQERASRDSAAMVADALIAHLTSVASYWRDTAYAERSAQLTRAQELLNSALRARTPRIRCGPTLAAGWALSGRPDALVGVGCTYRL